MVSKSSLLVILGLAGLVAACHAEVHASTSAEAKTDDTTKVTEPAPASTPAPAPAPAPPTTPPQGTCPLHCYVAWGADRAEVTNDELSQIQTAVEPALAKMRACTAENQNWRRHGSPVLQLRVEPDGIIHEIDVDPHHGYDYARSCIDDAARETNISLAMPGRKAVRCNERCETPRTTTNTRKRRR
jgi:hypothetical protein